MSEYFKLRAAIFPIILNDKNEILLHKRLNTGYMDNMWDLAGTGHIEKNETAKEALIRECKEELDIDVDINSINICHTVHRVGKSDNFNYIYLYFFVKNFQGTPKIVEKNKNAQLEWYSLTDLPKNIITDRKEAIENSFNNIFYNEFVV